MENKNNLSILVSVVICLVLVGVLIFISINKKVNMNSNDNLVAGGNPVSSSTGDVAKTGLPPASAGWAQTGDTVSMNYTGRLENGAVFDSNVDPKFKHVEPFVFTLGAGQVIAGWDKGIVGMKVGEKKTLTIPPADAYRADGVPGVIPPNSTLIFDVELVSINK
jgi:peptidylprolyl isomerase